MSEEKLDINERNLVSEEQKINEIHRILQEEF